MACFGIGVQLPAVLKLLVFTGFLFAPAARAVVVNDVRIQPLQGFALSTQAVMAYVSLKVGDEFNRSAISRDVRALQKTDRFSFVSVEIEEVPNGVDVIYSVKSKRKVRSLTIRGVDHIGTQKIRDIIGFGRGDFIDDITLERAAKKMQAAYGDRHFYEADIDWTLKNDEEFVDIVGEIAEGTRARVRRIRFEGGARGLKDRQLRKVMEQKQLKIFSWLNKSGTYDPDALETDILRLKRLFLDHGYLDVEIGEPRIERVSAEKIDIIIPVTSRRIYRIRSIAVEGGELFPVEEVTRRLTLKPGDVASMGAIERSMKTIRDFYGSRGYIRTRVKPDFNPDLTRAEMDIVFNVQEGNLSYIRDIHIRGNGITKDKVIRRELIVYPGNIFNEVKVARSERRLQNLGYFTFVRSQSAPTDKADEYDLIFEVQEKERGTGQFSIGAGFSSIDDIIGFVEISQGNFDIKGWRNNFRGGGQKLNFRAQLGTERRDLEISFTEPWFLDRKLSFRVDLFQSERNFLSDDYEQRNTGGRIGVGKAVGRYNRLNLRYGLENIKVFDVDEEASDAIKEEEGDRLKSAVTVEFVHDSRDSFFISTRGTRATLSAQLAGGILGGDTDLYRLEFRPSHYAPLWFGHIFNLRGWLAVVDEYGDSDRVPIFDRLFLGGARTVRGFSFRDVGPKDENGESIGGKTAVYATAEYTIPVFERLRTATFYDVGMVWEDAYDIAGDWNSSAGIGLRVDIPGFPLRLDYAWPLETDEFNDRSSGRFHFLLGYVY